MIKCYLCGCKEYNIRKGKCRDNELANVIQE